MKILRLLYSNILIYRGLGLNNISDGGGDFTCGFCNRKMANSTSLKYHTIRRHTQQKHFKCGLCHKAFVTNCELQRHVGSHERKGKKEVECLVCQRMFSTIEGLKAHEKTFHRSIKTFSCLFCDKSFRWKGSLFCHISNHTQEKSYFCGVCGKECMNQTNLEGHVRTHTKEYPYKCQLCVKTCSTATGLRVHVLTHKVMEKPHECVFCGERFITRINLFDHLRTEVGERPFECKLCGVNFSKFKGLWKHKKGSTHNVMSLAEEAVKLISFDELYL